MKTNVLVTMALMAGMMLAGCSKEESENVEEPRKENVMEQTLTKEQIVGVWRSGDYWVSFSEDGYCGAYLSNKCVAEGNYEITDKGVILVTSTVFVIVDGDPILKIAVDKCSGSVLSAHIDYLGLDYGWIVSDGDFTFTKSSDRPIGKTNELIGHTMETDKYTATFATSAQMDTDIENLIGYYVYLPPYLYYGEMVLFSCEFRRNETIIIKRVSIADNGDLLFED